MGSYDDETHELLIRLKAHLEETFMPNAEYISVFLLDDVEMYVARISSDREITLIVERYEGGLSLIGYDPARISVMYEDKPGRTWGDRDAVVEEALWELSPTTSFARLSILNKLHALSSEAFLIFLVRHLELTRGGEYVEMIYLMHSQGFDPGKFYFFKRENIDLSEMAWEVIDRPGGVNIRPYRDEVFLQRECVMIISNRLSDQRQS